ncbi:MAG: carboxypeptidase-like regulatory domain-containing protein, partial [Nitrososphaera sp.]|nr:carboxypeptidase-like regulatory domain-containing protein [Nitrososphaera sp.]
MKCLASQSLQRLGILLCCLLVYLSVTAQVKNVNVSGKVSNETGQPVPRASIVVKGATAGVKSDESGNFQITAPANGTLVISSVGFSAKEVAVNGQETINITLNTATGGDLEQVVVIGYGTQRKKDLTGAVSQVKATRLENENPASGQDGLRGNSPGIHISQINAASAKGGGDLLVRGKSSIRAGTSPLIVLDGVIYPGQLSDINPNDIATID